MIALIAAMAALIIAPPVIENIPQIANAVKSLTEGIVEGARNFWDNLKIACGGITAKKLKNKLVLSLDLVKEFINRKGKHIYLLLEPVSSKSDIMIPYQITDIDNAANWIKKGGSVWSPTSTTAKSAITKTNKYKPGIEEKGRIKLYEYETSSINNKLTFKHYHAITKKNVKIEQIHSFFALPL